MGRRLKTHRSRKTDIQKHCFFFEKAIRDATSGCMAKGDEDSVGDKKVVEDNQMYNPEGNQQKQVISKVGFDLGYEKCLENTYENSIQVSMKTSNRDVFQDQNLLIKKINVRF